MVDDVLVNRAATVERCVAMPGKRMTVTSLRFWPKGTGLTYNWQRP